MLATAEASGESGSVDRGTLGGNAATHFWWGDVTQSARMTTVCWSLYDEEQTATSLT